MARPVDMHCDPSECAATGALSGPVDYQVLLVSRSPGWEEAVHAAVSHVQGSKVFACGPREALVELASGDKFSYLLLEPDCADGLEDAFADLTGAHAFSPTSLVMLGGVHPLRFGVIRAADQTSIRQVLASPALSRDAALLTPGAEWTAMPTSELLAAIRSSMMQARYQPIVRLADRAAVSFEALARLNHPARGTLLPDHFVPQLEEAGFARELTQAVSARVFSDFSNKLLFPQSLSVALNFPLNVLIEPAALVIMDEQRAAMSVRPAQVTVELTESQPVEDLAQLVRSLEWLRTQGYSVSIDDVGPAVPRARELFDLPFTGMKLDKSVVQGSAMDPEMMGLLQGIVHAAKRRGLSIVAEGITTQALWDLMLAAGVDHGQGFLIARPLPVSAISIWLDALRQGGPHAGGL